MREDRFLGRRRLCTIFAKNYLGSALLLAESFQRHHPDIPIAALIVDARPEDQLGGFPFEVFTPDDLPLDAAEFGRMATYYDVTELSTALKPFMLRALLERGDEVVMYLDPDIEIFAPMHDIFDLAAEHQIVLTPHVTLPMPRDGLDVQEEVIFASGQFNLGFAAVSDAAFPFLAFWEERTRLHCLIDHGNGGGGYFTDQRWIDAVPTLFEHEVLRDTTCNVAFWNLHQRTLAVDDNDTWTVDGRPLRFFHYSGHDWRDPFRLSKHALRPRVRVDKQPALRRMLRERSERMEAYREPGSDAPYGWSRTVDGIRLDPKIRRYFREAVLEAERDETPYPPSACDPDGGLAFSAWLQAPFPRSKTPRHLLAHWRARPDLQAEFQDPLGAGSDRLMEWASLDANFVETTSTPLRLTPQWREATPGVNLVGYLAGEFGVAQASRTLGRMIRATGLPVASTTVRVENHRHHERPTTTFEGGPFDFSVIAVNPDELLRLWHHPELAPHRERKRVGVWYWEVGVLPESMRGAFDLVDEVWCASDYVRECLEPWGDRPVLKHPLVLEESLPTSLVRADIGLPNDKFLFGFVFDYSSVLHRKNPVGLVDAYCRAFGPNDGATLVLKTIHADLWPAAAARVREAAGERDDIIFLDGYLESLEVKALFHLLDCYVSLHRSEGLGLTLASAMAAGTPAIATGWSGNLEFMNEDNSILCPYDLIEVGKGADPYPAKARWADPDLDAAAGAMRRMFDSPEIARKLGAKARATFAHNFQPAAAAPWFVERFNTLTGRSLPA